MAKGLTRLTYRTLLEPKTHALFKTIIMFTQKRTLTRGKQTNVTKSSRSNDSGALTAKLKHKASMPRDPEHSKTIPSGSEQPIVANDRRRLDVDHCSSSPPISIERL